MTTIHGCREKLDGPFPEPCQMPIDVVETWVWRSVDGPVEHRRAECLAGHVVTEVVPMLHVADDDPLRRDRSVA